MLDLKTELHLEEPEMGVYGGVYSGAALKLLDVVIPLDQQHEVGLRLREELDPCWGERSCTNDTCWCRKIRSTLIHLNDEHDVPPEDVAPYLRDIRIPREALDGIRRQVRRGIRLVRKNRRQAQGELAKLGVFLSVT